MLAFALDVPLLAVNHIHAHIYACRLAAGRDIFPCVGLVASGGHTTLFDCRSAVEFQVLGATRDDAAGEAFDKVAAILSLGFPGGPAVDREAATGDPKAVKFPRSMLEPDSLDFSFSGLKTAVLYAVQGQERSKVVEPLTEKRRADVAASFQQAVVDVLVRKAQLGIATNRIDPPGRRRRRVGQSGLAQPALQSMCIAEQAELFIPPSDLCTDNAAMAALAVEKWKLGDFAPLDLDATPS